MIMGLAGFTIACNRAALVYEWTFAPGRVLLPAVGALFALVAAVFTVKVARYPREVLAEIRHPVKLAFVPTVSISLILLSIAALHQAPGLSRVLWTVGTVMHALLTLYVLSSWLQHDKFEIAHLNPAWFIPVVGNILVPIAGVRHASPEISWVFFAFGLFFWPVLTAIVFYRLIFHGSLPERFMPTLAIFIAPPAVGFLSYLNLAGAGRLRARAVRRGAGLDGAGAGAGAPAAAVAVLPVVVGVLVSAGGDHDRHAGDGPADEGRRLPVAGRRAARVAGPGGGVPAGAHGRRGGAAGDLRGGTLGPNAPIENSITPLLITC